MPQRQVTLAQYIVGQADKTEGTHHELSQVLCQVATATKIISQQLTIAGLTGSLGATNQTNIQGEIVQKLDDISNTVFLESFAHGKLVTDMVSEEMDEPAEISGNSETGKYVVFVDPLDGSSNIDVNVTIGSIFSVHLRPNVPKPGLKDALRLRGNRQIAAGYSLYGPSTTLVYTIGDGVHCFTLDRGIGEFFLSQGNIRIPAVGKTYSINEGRRNNWFPETVSYIAYLQENDSVTHRPYSGRYVGSLVADFHRTLLKGGIFLYPADPKNKNGKLRLMYEAAPMAMVIEQAGGRASNGILPIRDLVPNHLHERTPLLIGSPEDVRKAESYYTKVPSQK